MKTYAHYDLEGTIRSIIVVNAPRGAGMMLAPRPGLFVSEVEGLNIKDPTKVEAVRKVLQAHRVEAPFARRKVTKKIISPPSRRTTQLDLGTDPKRPRGNQ